MSNRKKSKDQKTAVEATKAEEAAAEPTGTESPEENAKPAAQAKPKKTEPKPTPSTAAPGDIFVGSIKKSPMEEVRFGVRSYKGRRYMDIRLFYVADSGEWLPTKKGIALSPDFLPEFLELTAKLAETLAANPNGK